MSTSFSPPRLISGPHLQSILSSAAPRRTLVRRRASAVLGASRKVVLELPDQVRLAGFLTQQQDQPDAPLAVLLHGWEGHAESSYLVATAQKLHEAGVDVFRLNLRDHGGTHDLNTGVFHSCRIDEVVHAVAEIYRKHTRGRLLLAGFSLGGNFALRVALRAPAAQIPLAQVIAVSPVINPASSMAALDSGPYIYQAYFLRKWRRSLRAKQAAFPDQYRFDPRLRGNLWDLTDILVREYTDFADAQAYFDGYSIGSGRLAELRIPATIVTSKDDPIIPISDFDQVPDIPAISLMTTTHGGHCAFIEDWRLNSWVSTFIAHQFSAGLEAHEHPGRPRQNHVR